ncbi:hypothetical protein [Sphingopyxis sp. RIFCSPHIGHO2_12_FULL_65_19]|uniref:hypothetical protein n=1 Tax=Sphingopyxis sp. RIFCSPHIGHO2_12_FULL_65_19 TaxID=1802172 RepID=UPI0008B70182|nr:hypothetical protein [Sphingopyxis sp. RIFCSPHIGHO2_12_FULL_65_19]OHD08815.1 MAG: hypothetical protein A3E77_08140 [Sphingopyxis sp. RIFCSPHIGHO2_12_FULL_65_19]
MIAALLIVAALAADPVAAPTAPAVTTPASAAAIADTDLREFAAIAGRKVVGRPVGGPYPNADKVLLIARDDKGYPAIAASIGFPVRQSLPPPPATTLAVIRIHQRYETTIPGPTPDDIAFVAANKLPLFVIGEWARPAPMWEVAWIDDAVRFRTIGEVGEIGPWQD